MYLLVHVDPATSVHEGAREGLGLLAITLSGHADKLDWASWEEVEAWDSVVNDSLLSLDSLNVDELEAGEAFEESSVWCADGHLHLSELGSSAEVSHVLAHESNSGESVSCLHI